ncbi:MAG: hypothetical protein A2Y38_12200 [Spirochaetes bacterium GWB1_59_5]|nr:MAG: hypothetical protein A2Y38_12200 [Spirochaetes bacterium GWB1_59_5]
MLPSIGNLVTAIQRFLIGTRAFTSGAIAIGTTKSKVKTASIINFCIDGIMYVKAATDDLFVFTDLTVQAANTTKYYLLGLDSSGAATITPGTSTALPDCPAGVCPVGYLKIVTTAAFTPATTLLDAAGITTTYVNLSCAPTALA